ncbi:hypothetical protein ACFXJ8_42235 [Nonomuraea sp. NPDC059194]|uniref:hypothetical protein n=1 Tax=Nonomuraea sp. NPDC059194 TaxID=3346764 RepID=UPI0036873B40
MGTGKPVAKIATGFVFAFGALRFNGFDLLLDPVGWGLCASGLSQLQRSADDPFGRARIAAVAMACMSLVTMIASDSQAIGIANTVGALIAVWLVVDAIIRRIRPSGEIARAALLDVLRWAVVGLGVLGLLAGYGYADLGPVTLVAWFASLVTLVVVLYRSARLPSLSPQWEPVTS